MLSLSKLYNFIYSSRQSFFASLAVILGFLSVRIYLVLAMLTNILIWVLVLLFKRQLTQNLIILHFNVDFGVDLIGSPEQIFIMPVLGLLVLIVNCMILFFLRKNEHFKFLVHLLLASALFVNELLLIALGPIYYINFR